MCAFGRGFLTDKAELLHITLGGAGCCYSSQQLTGHPSSHILCCCWPTTNVVVVFLPLPSLPSFSALPPNTPTLSHLQTQHAQLLCVIPRSAILSPRTSQLAAVLEAERLGGGLALTIAVMYEASLGQESKW